jgi:uncharacterized protein (TIGR03790 family)
MTNFTRVWIKGGLAMLSACFLGHSSLAIAEEWNAAAETIVVYNPNFEGSEALAKFYAAKRQIPEARLIALPCSNEETISRQDFEDTIQAPLLKKLTDEKWWEIEKRDLIDPKGKRYGPTPMVIRSSVNVLVLMRGVPSRVSRAAAGEVKQNEADEASVDSELAALGMMQKPLKGVYANRYHQSTLRFPDCYEARGQLLVGRLDAADDATVRRMIEDTLQAAVVDFSLMEGGYVQGEQWLGRCVSLYREEGIPVHVERSKELLRDAWPLPDTILYFGWYTDQCRGALASPNFRFKPGAIACHLHSFSASVLRSKDQHWAGPLLDHGAAAVLGNVWEPFLGLTVHFDLLNARLVDGFTLGEAAWSATPGVSWMNVLIGDPLYRPFPKGRTTVSDAARDRDYILYHDLVSRYLPHDPKKFRKELVRIAEEKQKASLLELAGLLSIVEEHPGEAMNFLQHARALYQDPEDQLRCGLYESTLLSGEAAQVLLNHLTTHQPYLNLPSLAAAKALLKK